ncbi:MAG: flagellar filament outer layer protein FlaA [Spirochaetales bacterium]|nr:flagellar filament outer layer protein FlaA [Spirochaetales bacterium]
MKKSMIVAAVLLVALSGFIGAQTLDIDPTATGIVTAQQKLKEISVSKMEDAGFWYGIFPGDNGIIEMRAFPGGPADKEPVEAETQFGLAETDENVVGAKVSFYKRGVVDFTLKPIRPLPIEGITKTISIWVAGRNTNHELQLLVSDHFGNKAVVPMGKLNFSGWKQLTVTIPPTVKQRDYHYNDRMGISIDGFNVRCNIDETYGRYYVYFDDIRAVTDLFAEETRDADDMMDAW